MSKYVFKTDRQLYGYKVHLQLSVEGVEESFDCGCHFDGGRVEAGILQTLILGLSSVC